MEKLLDLITKDITDCTAEVKDEQSGSMILSDKVIERNIIITTIEILNKHGYLLSDSSDYYVGYTRSDGKLTMDIQFKNSNIPYFRLTIRKEEYHNEPFTNIEVSYDLYHNRSLSRRKARQETSIAYINR